MREGDGFLLVYSIISKLSFDEMQMLREKIMRNKEDDEQALICIAGNKCDLEHMRQVQTSEVEALAKEWGCPWYETSAKDRINNCAVFHEVVRLIAKAREGDMVDDAKCKKKRKFGCTIL